MARRLTLDTSFLIDLQRERRRGSDGPAHRFLAAEEHTELALSTVALGEITEGCRAPDHPFLQVIRSTLTLLPVDEEAALHYGAAAARLREQGALPGTNDLWIAAVALRHHLPLVTGDVGHFERIPGLALVRYR